MHLQSAPRTEPAPSVVETGRLRIRPLEEDDVEALLAVYGDALAMRWVGNGDTLDRAQCEQWIEITRRNYERYGYGMYAIVERASAEVIGFCGLVHPGSQPTPELKYALLRRAWGKGFATEAASALLAFGATRFGLRTIIATTAPENSASHKVLRKAGMRQGELRTDADGTQTLFFNWEAPATGNSVAA